MEALRPVGLGAEAGDGSNPLRVRVPGMGVPSREEFDFPENLNLLLSILASGELITELGVCSSPTVTFQLRFLPERAVVPVFVEIFE